jgi:F-type H+-transporting ATPase subunit delta
MANRKVARRYSKALYSLASELKQIDNVKKDFIDIKSSINASKELKMFIESPIINPYKKSAVLNELFSTRVSELSMKFILLLSEKNRINILYDIADNMLSLINEERGIIEAKITTAIEMTEKEKNTINSMLKKYTGKEISPEFRVDSSIKGGFLAKIDDKIIDASISRQLELLKEKFLQGSFNN